MSLTGYIQHPTQLPESLCPSIETVTNVSSIVELLQQSSDPFEARALLLEINELLHDAINKTKIG